ncbi:3312_t:CDS:2, partial [Entrophospora sp. SA101]
MQSTDSLRELNTKLLAEIAKLRKENTEIPELREKLLRFVEVEAENARLKQIIEENARRDAENAELKSRVRELEARLALLEQGSAVDGMVLSFGQTQNDKEAMSVVTVTTDVTKIPEVTDMLTSEQDEQGLSQSYEASSESISSAYCILPKQPQVNASKLAYNLENHEDSSRSESCGIEELKSNQHGEVITKLDKNIIVEQELKQQLSSPAHTSRSDQTSEEQDPSIRYCTKYKKYDKRIDNFVAGGVKKKTATSMAYQEIKQLLPEITDVNLRQKILRARKLYKLFNTLGLEKIKQVSYSTDAISSLNYQQIQDIIDYVNSVTSSHNETMKILHDQKCSDGNVNYYGITDNTSCSLCRLDHDDIEGEYKDGTYYIKFKSDKVLTPKYLDWYSKLTDLPTMISDKLHSKLYKIYKEKTGLDPWIKSETSESPQSENADNHILQDSSLKTQ